MDIDKLLNHYHVTLFQWNTTNHVKSLTFFLWFSFLIFNHHGSLFWIFNHHGSYQRVKVVSVEVERPLKVGHGLSRYRR